MHKSKEMESTRGITSWKIPHECRNCTLNRTLRATLTLNRTLSAYSGLHQNALFESVRGGGGGAFWGCGGGSGGGHPSHMWWNMWWNNGQVLATAKLCSNTTGYSMWHLHPSFSYLRHMWVLKPKTRFVLAIPCDIYIHHFCILCTCGCWNPKQGLAETKQHSSSALCAIGHINS